MKQAEIPTTITTKLFVTIDVKADSYSYGQVRTDCFDLTESYPDGDEYHKYIKLYEQEVILKIPPCELDLTTQSIIYLQDRKRRIMAEHHVVLREIDNQIQELRTITYQPQEQIA
jgi:hypothetical protein